MNSFTGVRDAAILLVLVGIGLRVSGLAGLNEGDLVSDADETDKLSAFIRVAEKGGHQRFVPLPDEAFLMIRAYMGHEYLEQIDRTLPSGDQVLFVNTRSPRVPAFENCGEHRRLSTTGIRRMIQRRAGKAGIPADQAHPHALRHLFGTEMAEADTDIITLRQLMGHVSTESTQVYVHLSTRRLRRAVDKGNPLGKMKTPVSGLAHLLRRESLKTCIPGMTDLQQTL